MVFRLIITASDLCSSAILLLHFLSFSFWKCASQQAFHISRQTFREFNHYVVIMVNCLWNSRMFHPGMGVQLGEELLLKSNVPQYGSSFDLVHHPAFMSYAVNFHQKVSARHLSWFGLNPTCYSKTHAYFHTAQGIWISRQRGYSSYRPAKCGVNVSFTDDALIQKEILLLMSAAWDGVFHQV